MPNVLNLNLETAKLSIVQSGLAVGQVNEEASEEIAEGLVMRQSVEAGQEVEEGTPIWLTVSTGKPEEEEPVEPVQEEGVFPLAISLPKEKDSVAIVIQRIASDGREVVYSEEADTAEGSILVNVKGSGTGIFEIYIDNELYDRVEINFE